jgi:hypothetical protein
MSSKLSNVASVTTQCKSLLSYIHRANLKEVYVNTLHSLKEIEEKY